MSLTNSLSLFSFVGSALLVHGVMHAKSWPPSTAMTWLPEAFIRVENEGVTDLVHKTFASKTESNFSGLSDVLLGDELSVVDKSLQLDPAVGEPFPSGELLTVGLDQCSHADVDGDTVGISEPTLEELALASAALYAEVSAAPVAEETLVVFQVEWLDAWLDTLKGEGDLNDSSVEELVDSSAALHAEVKALVADRTDGSKFNNEWLDAWFDTLHSADEDSDLAVEELAASSAALHADVTALIVDKAEGQSRKRDVEWVDAWIDTLRAETVSAEFGNQHESGQAVQNLAASSEALHAEVSLLVGSSDRQVGQFDVEWVDTWLDTLRVY